MDDIGEYENALLCVTDRAYCCQTVRAGDWLYPDNTYVPTVSAGSDLYRNRGPQAVRLNRRNDAISPTGKYLCMIPDSRGVSQTLVANIIGKSQVTIT